MTILKIRLSLVTIFLIAFAFIYTFSSILLAQSEGANRPLTLPEGNTNWYVDNAVTTSGDGRTPLTAFKAITESLLVALSGDTIHIAAGTYPGGFNIREGIIVQGAGYTNTIIDGNKTKDAVISLWASSVISGVKVIGSSLNNGASGIYVKGSGARISSTYIVDNSSGVTVYCSGFSLHCPNTVHISQSIIEGNRRYGFHVIDNTPVKLKNNTIVDNGDTGVKIPTASSVMENNIVAFNRNGGIRCPSNCTISHNLLWENTVGSIENIPGEYSLTKNPLFNKPDAHDFRLTAGSPARGAGNPSGTDLGALPFIPYGNPPDNLSLIKQSDYAYNAEWTSNGAGSYRLYLGPEAGNFDRFMDLGNNTSVLLANLRGHITYYAALSSLTQSGDESNLGPAATFYIPPAYAGVHEETSPALVAKGEWQRISHPKASGGAYFTNTGLSNELEITFEGDSIAIYRMMSQAEGLAYIYVDDEELSSDFSLRFYSSEPRWQVPAVFDNLGEGIHTLRIVAAYDDSIAIDRIVIPANLVATNVQQRALKEVNFYRAIAGIPVVRDVPAINLAAQSHAEFIANHHDDPQLNGLGVHVEPANLPGFTGQYASDRTEYFGYTGGTGEDVASTGDPLTAIDWWMQSVYHRNLIMKYGFIEMGFGSVDDSRIRIGVLNMGSRVYQRPQDRMIYTYPAAGQTEVPLQFGGGELPEPLPGQEYPVGYPISLYIAQPSINLSPEAKIDESMHFDWLQKQIHTPDDWTLSLAELHEANGQLIPTYLLDRDTDPHQFLGEDNVFLIAHKPLKTNTTYTVHIAGTDSRGAVFDHRWSFTTIPNAGITNAWTSSGACGASLYWQTGGEATTYVEYGRNASYGFRQTAQSNNGNSHSAELTGLTLHQTYHYRIVSQDAEGHTRMTEDRTITTRTSQVIHVPQDAATISEAVNRAGACDVIKVAPGVYNEFIQIRKKIILLGSGSGNTFLRGDSNSSAIYVTQDATISGFTIDADDRDFWDAGIFVVDNASPHIVNNRIVGNSMGIATYCFTEPCHNQLKIQNNIVANNKESGIFDTVGGATIVNNTIINNKQGVYLGGSGPTLINNIIVQNHEVGLHSDASGIRHGYNNVWGNKQNYRNVTAGQDDISVDPQFVNIEGDYHLLPGSACIDAGDPDQSYVDQDGSRNDLGAYGGAALTARVSASVSTSPLQPKRGDEVTFHIQVVNRGIEPNNVQVTASIPERTIYVAGSASTSQGAVTTNNPVSFDLGETVPDVPVMLSYTVKVDDAVTEPVALRSSTAVTWSGGSISRDTFVIVNGMAIYLPVIAR